MECPFLVRYNDGYWLHEFYYTNPYLQRSISGCLEEGTGKYAEFEAGVWCTITQKTIKIKIVMKGTYSDTTSTQPNC